MVHHMRQTLLLIVAVLTLFVSVSVAIYPADHWEYSTDIGSGSHLHELITETLKADKALLAPAWNAIVKEYHAAEDIVFADVMLSKTRITKYGAGQGGWPTIRYFNAATGPNGQAYEKQTTQSMCGELGDMKYLRAYVELARGKSGAEGEVRAKPSPDASRIEL